MGPVSLREKIQYSATIPLMISLCVIFPPLCYGISQGYQLKAAFVYKFLHFIEWGTDPKTKVICGLDDGSFNSTLDELIKINDPAFAKTKTLSVQHEEDLRSCDVVFLGRSQGKMVPEVLTALASLPILTVSDVDQFAKAGGIIELTMEESHVRFIINQRAAREKGLQISSQLLALAKEVISER